MWIILQVNKKPANSSEGDCIQLTKMYEEQKTNFHFLHTTKSKVLWIIEVNVAAKNY